MLNHLKKKFQPGQRHLFQATCEPSLAGRFRKGGVTPDLATGDTVSAISGKGIQFDGNNESSNNPVQLGRQIAQSVYGGIGK